MTLRRALEAAALLGAGVMLGRMLLSPEIDRAYVSRAVVSAMALSGGSSVDERLRQVGEMERAWPGFVNWVIRHGGEARTLFEANGNSSCPASQVARAKNLCVFVAPPVANAGDRRGELPPVGGALRR